MEHYMNQGGNSNVVAFENESDSIKVQFRDGSVYMYTNQSAGVRNIAEMHRLALQGQGLNGFINQVVKKGYVRKLR